MKNGSKNDGLDWMKGIGFRIVDCHPEFTVVRHDKIPMDAGKRIYMVKEDLVDFRGHGVLIYFAEWSVWPSGE